MRRTKLMAGMQQQSGPSIDLSSWCYAKINVLNADHILRYYTTFSRMIIDGQEVEVIPADTKTNLSVGVHEVWGLLSDFANAGTVARPHKNQTILVATLPAEVTSIRTYGLSPQPSDYPLIIYATTPSTNTAGYYGSPPIYVPDDAVAAYKANGGIIAYNITIYPLSEFDWTQV